MKTSKKEPEKKQADWMAIVVHFIFGAIVTTLLTYRILIVALEHDSDSSVFILWIVICLIGGSISALYQNRIWMRDYAGTIPPMEPKHSPFSQKLLWALFAIGVLLIILPILAVIISHF